MAADDTRIRRVYIDIMRITAAFAVIVLHVSAKHWYDTDVAAFEWKVFDLYNSLTRWSVPVFVMISGSLFLSAERSIKMILKKNLFRIITSFIFWSFIYATVNYLEGSSINDCVAFFIKGPYHMWFMLMIAGLYIITPLLYKLVEDDQKCLYFLVLSLIFAVILPQIITFLSLQSEYKASLLSGVINMMEIKFVMGYTGYYILGLYLHKKDLRKRHIRIIYAVGALGFLLTFILSLFSPYILFKQKTEYFFGYMTLNVLFESMGVFTFFKTGFKDKNLSGKTGSVLKKLSDQSFGIFLVHALIIDMLEKAGFGTMTFNPVISVPVISLAVFVISLFISVVIHRIPVLNRYVV